MQRSLAMMMNHPNPLAAVVLTLAACTNPVDTSDNVLPQAGTVDTHQTADGSVGDCACLAVGTWFMFDTLALTSIDQKQHAVIPTLNILWANDIAVRDLNVLMEVTEVSDESVTMRVSNGARVDATDSICNLTTSAIPMSFPRTGCALALSSEATFNVYAGTLEYPKTCALGLPVKNSIPVSKARLEGVLTPSCDAITHGKVPAGGLGQAELGQICTCLLPPGAETSQCDHLDPAYQKAPCNGCNKNFKSLGELLEGFDALAWKCQSGSGGPAACVTAEWSAKRLEAAPEACPE